MKSFVLGQGPFRVEISSELGGRVTRLVHGDQDLFTDESVNSANHGSTYWPSPQELWGWPPVSEIDGDRYDVVSEAPLVLVSRECALGGTRVTLEKSFVLVEVSSEGLVLDRAYRLANVGASPLAVAGWEISRVAPGGLTFFPSGETEITPVAPHGALPIERESGVTFFDHAEFRVGQSKKLNADGREGFLAHLVRSGASPVLFLMLFDDTRAAEQAPGEGEVEIFANEDGRYVEVEVQGAFEKIEPRSVQNFRVRWVTANVSSDVADDRDKLVAFARELVGKWRPRGAT